MVLCFVSTTLWADYPERAAIARNKGKKMMVKEWKTTPDGKKKWVDHAEVYNANGQLIEEAEYSDFGTRLAWRAEFEYNEKGELVTERIYNDSGVCVRRLNYSANGVLNSYRQFEFVFE